MCDCFLKPYDKVFIFDCSHKNLTNVPNNITEPDVLFIRNLSISVDTISQFYLNFSHNRLTQMPDLEKLKLRSVDKLSLSFNDISYISLHGLSKTTKVRNLIVFYIRITYKKSLKQLLETYAMKINSNHI